MQEVMVYHRSGQCNTTWFITGQDSVTPHGSWRQGKCKMIWLTDAKECKKSWFIDTYWRSGHSKMIWLTDAKESVRGHGLLTPRKVYEVMAYSRQAKCTRSCLTDAKESVRGHGLLTPRKLQEFMTYPRSGECKMTWFTDAKKSQICCDVTITTRKSPRRNDLKKNDCWLGKCNK